jgi:hypothetical protein
MKFTLEGKEKQETTKFLPIIQTSKEKNTLAYFSRRLLRRGNVL